MQPREVLHIVYRSQCTHIDHQIRLVIGTLREEGLLDDTIIVFTSDHGDMLGNHGVWAKRAFYEDSANVPMILVGRTGESTGGDGRVAPGASKTGSALLCRSPSKSDESPESPARVVT